MEQSLEETTNNLTEIPIMGPVLGKIKAYARLADASEVYGFLLADDGKTDGIVTDAMLAINQHASSASAGIRAAVVGESKAYIENHRQKAIGFWHSHGSFGAWHSGTDDGNLRNLLGSLASNNETRMAREHRNYRYMDGDKVVYRTNKYEIAVSLEKDIGYESRRLGEDYLKLLNGQEDVIAALTSDFRLLIKDGSSIIIARNPGVIEIRKPDQQEVRLTGAAYSIVVNMDGDQYAEMAITRWCSLCERDEVDIRKNAGLRVFGPEECEIEDPVLLGDLESNVRGFKVGGLRKWMRGITGRD